MVGLDILFATRRAAGEACSRVRRADLQQPLTASGTGQTLRTPTAPLLLRRSESARHLRSTREQRGAWRVQSAGGRHLGFDGRHWPARRGRPGANRVRRYSCAPILLRRSECTPPVQSTRRWCGARRVHTAGERHLGFAGRHGRLAEAALAPTERADTAARYSSCVARSPHDTCGARESDAAPGARIPQAGATSDSMAATAGSAEAALAPTECADTAARHSYCVAASAHHLCRARAGNAVHDRCIPQAGATLGSMAATAGSAEAALAPTECADTAARHSSCVAASAHHLCRARDDGAVGDEHIPQAGATSDSVGAPAGSAEAALTSTGATKLAARRSCCVAASPHDTCGARESNAALGDMNPSSVATSVTTAA